MKTNRITGRTAWVDGKEYIYFGGTSYLNLPYEKAFQQFIAEGMALYGSGLGSSPVTLPQLAIYEELENYLAQYYGFEAALLFSTGRAATKTLIQLASQRFTIAYGPFAHAALRISQKENNDTPTIWANDFVDPVSLARVDELNHMPAQPKIIDASHAFGVLDTELKSFCQQHSAFACGSLNKGLGIHAGVVLCDGKTKKALQETLAYQSSSNASPKLCYALLNAFKSGFIEAQQEKLKALVHHLANMPTVTIKPPFPVGYLEPEEDIYEKLKANGVLLWKGGYGPTQIKPGRFVISAGHGVGDLDKLIR